MEFENLKYSPGWFAKKFPGFYNEECYYILSDYFLNKTTERTGVKRTLDDLYQDDEQGVEETKDVLPTELDTIDQPLANLSFRLFRRSATETYDLLLYARLLHLVLQSALQLAII